MRARARPARTRFATYSKTWIHDRWEYRPRPRRPLRGIHSTTPHHGRTTPHMRWTQRATTRSSEGNKLATRTISGSRDSSRKRQQLVQRIHSATPPSFPCILLRVNIRILTILRTTNLRACFRIDHRHSIPPTTTTHRSLTPPRKRFSSGNGRIPLPLREPPPPPPKPPPRTPLYRHSFSP